MPARSTAELAEWWEDFSLGDDDERVALLEAVREQQPPRRVAAARPAAPAASAQRTRPSRPTRRRRANAAAGAASRPARRAPMPGPPTTGAAGAD